MTTREQARDEAVALIARRLTELLGQPAADRPDPEVWAAALLTELAGFGWRPTAARPEPWQPRPERTPATATQVHAYADHIRRQLTREGEA
ncbi:hypothetical protein AB0I72_19375 [Nocardiopsis sp. NPDC049922]|uniref:hypothetical protein n=1 Tax=Nocardiopsis sp. NPDC049922 TaxID=3155157 RepID=UPI0033C4993E